MKTFALAFLAAMPMACLANLIGGFDLKFDYYKASGTNDQCDNPTQELFTGEGAKSLSLFNCDQKNAGDEICYCIIGKINGRKLFYENMCATCSLAAKPNQGFTEIFQYGAYYELLVNLVEKITLRQELTNHDLYVFGVDNGIKIPIFSPKKMGNYTSQFKEFINNAPNATDAEKQTMNNNMKAAFNKYTGLEDLKHEQYEHLIKNLKKMMPQILEKLKIGNSIDYESNEFKKKLDKAMEQVKPGILDGDDEKKKTSLDETIRQQKASMESGL